MGIAISRPASDGSQSASSSSTSTGLPEGWYYPKRLGDPPPWADQPSETINPQHLEVRQVPGRGRGVFANKDLRAGTKLEDAPVLVITKEQWEDGKMNDSILGEYGFCWSNGGMAIGLGIASLFNHSSQPNVNFVRNTAEGTITFTTSRSVSKGDELCICYSADESKLWFVPSGGVKVAVSEDEGDGTELFSDLALGDEAAVEAQKKAEARATRREMGGKTHVAKEKRRARAAERKAKKEAAAKQVEKTAAEVAAIKKTEAKQNGSATPAAPQVNGHRLPNGDSKIKPKAEPSADPTSSSAPSPQGTSVASTSPSQQYTTPPSSVNGSETSPSKPLTGPPEVVAPQSAAARLAARQRRGERRADLPPPLHGTVSSSRHNEHVEPASELDWEFVEGERLPEEMWGYLRRAKGPVEKEEEAEADDTATIHVWVVQASDPQETPKLLTFTKNMDPDPRMRHLKRVKRWKDNTGAHTAVALAMHDMSPFKLKEKLKDEADLDLEPYLLPVPRAAARTADQLKARNKIWPVLYSPTAQRPYDARGITPAKLAWIRAGIERVIADARAARDKGELPIAVYCAAAPESLWPTTESFIPPTPGLQAEAHDTRNSEKHPLRHAVLNCIARVARLRTVPPFSELQPTRNGADYLLTSLTLFVTHEPCVMCSMALLHSRVKEVYFIYPRKRSGGLEGSYGVHSRRDLNHRFDAWQWIGDGWCPALDLRDIPDNLEV